MKEGHFYKARIRGRDCIVQFQGGYALDHCLTCTCVSQKAVFVVVGEEANVVPAGPVIDIQIFEEVEDPSKT